IVPLGYLLVAVCTAAALIAPRRPWGVGRAAYLLAVVVNELPQLALLYLLGTTALAVVEGDLVGTQGLVAGGVAALTVVGLGEIARRGIHAPGVVAEALGRAGIGAANHRWRSR